MTYTTVSDACCAVLASKLHYFAQQRILAKAKTAGASAAAHGTTQAIRHALYETAYCATVAAALEG